MLVQPPRGNVKQHGAWPNRNYKGEVYRRNWVLICNKITILDWACFSNLETFSWNELRLKKSIFQSAILTGLLVSKLTIRYVQNRFLLILYPITAVVKPSDIAYNTHIIYHYNNYIY